MKIFVSYSRKDADISEHVSEYFSDSDHSVFTDVHNIRLGDPWSKTIEDNIYKCDVFVVIITQASLRSQEIEKEVSIAQKANKKIIPCRHKHVRTNAIRWGLGVYQGLEFDDKYDLARDLYYKIEGYQNNSSTYTTTTAVKHEEPTRTLTKTKEVYHDDDVVKPSNENIIQNSKNAEDWHNKGWALQKQERYREAIECYDEALRISPHYADAWKHKSWALNMLGEDSEAKASQVEFLKSLRFNLEQLKLPKLGEVKIIKYFTSDGKPVYQ